MNEPTLKEVMDSQGTRLQDLPPWMTYASSLDEKVSPDLAEGIKRYSEHRHDRSSSQNEEEYCKQKEMSDEMAKEYQWLHPSEYSDAGPRVGRILHSSEVINKLRKCGIRCWYRQHPQPKKITLVVYRDGELQVGCWAQHGYMPEYSIVRFDEHGVPLDEKFRGWRTMLLQLILKGLLTEDDANKEFGYASGPASVRYRSTLYSFRSAGNIT